MKAVKKWLDTYSSQLGSINSLARYLAYSSVINMNELRSILSSNLITQVGMADAEEVLSCKVIGLYFSASWCPPCRMLTPIIAQMYSEVNQDHKQFEIIYVSSDRDEETYLENFEEMPWKAISFSETEFMRRLGQELKVYGIPHLVVMNSKLEIIDNRARITFNEKGKDSFAYWEELARADKEGPTQTIEMKAEEPGVRAKPELEVKAKAEEEGKA
jgi:nucleoredoxin